MQIFYSVKTTRYKNGTFRAVMDKTIEANKKPVTEQVISKRKEIFIDWFDSLEKAKEFLSACLECGKNWH